MAPGHRLYVEVSNEVWNGRYAVARQAADEAKLRKLPSADRSGAIGDLDRYAEKTKNVMEIWLAISAAALALLSRCPDLPHKAAGFLGHVCVAPALSDKQRGWLTKLLERHGLPTLLGEALI